MPRAKKPAGSPETDHPEKHPIPCIQLKDDQKKTLAKYLRIENDTDRADAAVAEVESALTWYKFFFHEFDNAPSSASILAALEPLQRAAKKLQKQLDALDPYTRQTLYSHSPVKDSVIRINASAKYKSDVKAVEGLFYRTKNAIIALSNIKKKGRREQAALRMTMSALFFTFVHYTNIHKKRNLNAFIHSALNFARIDHPNPYPSSYPSSQQLTRFKDLFREAEEAYNRSNLPPLT